MEEHLLYLQLDSSIFFHLFNFLSGWRTKCQKSADGPLHTKTVQTHHGFKCEICLIFLTVLPSVMQKTLQLLTLATCLFGLSRPETRRSTQLFLLTWTRSTARGRRLLILRAQRRTNRWAGLTVIMWFLLQMFAKGDVILFWAKCDV